MPRIKNNTMNLKCVLRYYNDETGSYWVARCDDLNIEITADTIEEAMNDLDEIIDQVLESMSNEELTHYNIQRVEHRPINIRIKYTIPTQTVTVRENKGQASFC